MRKTVFPQAHSPSQIVSDHTLGPVFLLDQAAGVVWATDKLFLHDPRLSCLHPSDPSKMAFVTEGGTCPDDTVATRRARLDIGQPPIAMGIDQDQSRLAIIGEDALLFWVQIDPLSGPSIDHMRAIPGPNLVWPGQPLTSPILAIQGDMIGLAEGSEVSMFTASGVREEAFEADEPILDLQINAAGWWALTESQLVHNGEAIGQGGHRLTFWNGEPWVQHGDTLSGPVGAVQVPGASGPITPWIDRLLVVTEDGLVAVHPDLTIDTVWTGAALDVSTNDAGEVAILRPDGQLDIYVDERPPPGAATLHVWLNTFLEHPRTYGEQRPCSAADKAQLDTIYAMADRQMELLDDLPISTALGITPSHMHGVLRCDALKDALSITANVDAGVLFHDIPTLCIENEDCHARHLLEALSQYPMPISWVSGLPSHTELGIDWIASLTQTNAPSMLNFFSASLQQDVPHISDLRSKESWPMSLSDHTRSWRADSIEQLGSQEDHGGITILPGNNVSAFNLGACPNLLVTECHALGRGNGERLSDEDIASLDLLVHRALRSANGPGLHTWNFHLPDIGLYDFTENCEVSNDLWLGEDCEGRRLQQWLIDIHQRFVMNGRIAWATPASLTDD